MKLSGNIVHGRREKWLDDLNPDVDLEYFTRIC